MHDLEEADPGCKGKSSGSEEAKRYKIAPKASVKF